MKNTTQRKPAGYSIQDQDGREVATATNGKDATAKAVAAVEGKTFGSQVIIYRGGERTCSYTVDVFGKAVIAN